MFPLNAWYVACMPHELGEKPLGRTICALPMVFYRDSAGKPQALDDFCPHRGAPLSLGSIVDGRLRCGYHGLTVSCDGKAHSMPGQRVQGFPATRVYAVEERHGFVWVWPGQAHADPGLIPALPWSGRSDWAFGGDVMHVACDFRLMIDNLMDLTHETYVHATSIGQKEIDETPCRTQVVDGVVTTSREMHDILAPPFWQQGMRANGIADDRRVDRWQICRFVPPSNVLIDVGVALSGQGGINAPEHAKAAGIVVDLLTPETADSMWYFWGMARNFRAAEEDVTVRTREAQRSVFMEDVAMLEAQHRALRARPERKLLSLNIDAGGVQARRILQRLADAERAPAGAQDA